MTIEQTYETVEGVEGLVAIRVMEYEGRPVLEAEPQDPQYATRIIDDEPVPPIVRIELTNGTDEYQVAAAKALIPDCLAQMLAAG